MTRVIGLMSGTSADGIDAALVRFEDGSADSGGGPVWKVEAFVSSPYPTARRARLLESLDAGTPASICRLHADLGDWFAEAALAACGEADVTPDQVDAIGSHGHTLWHEPPTAQQSGATLQIGDPARIAERTGIDVISDFRSRDVAAGGHGAPLVVWADQWLFTHPLRARAIQNVGGMANVTWLAAGGAEPPLAFDTGPGCALIDEAAAIATDGAAAMDEDGRRAARGHIDETLLAELLAHPFLSRPPPRSTGRELFGRTFVRELSERRGGARPDDLVATLTAFTVRSIAEAYGRWVLPRGLDEVFVAGGGARNPTLMAWLAEALDGVRVVDGGELGLDPDAREAVGFAALAWAFRKGRPANVPGATGASGPRILGSFTPGGRS